MTELYGSIVPEATGRTRLWPCTSRRGARAITREFAAGDTLLQVASHSIENTVDVPQALQRVGIWNKTEYLVSRDNVPVPAQVIVGEGVVDRAVYYTYMVGIAYLLIGLFVYYRRVSAPRSVHFYVLCLTSFVLYCFHYTGKLNAFDQVIYFGNVAAGILAPTIFLHFCLVFPDRPKWLQRRGSGSLLYLPWALLTVYVLVAKGILRVSASSVEVSWFLDRACMLYLSASIWPVRRCCRSRPHTPTIRWSGGS